MFAESVTPQLLTVLVNNAPRLNALTLRHFPVAHVAPAVLTSLVAFRDIAPLSTDTAALLDSLPRLRLIDVPCDDLSTQLSDVTLSRITRVSLVNTSYSLLWPLLTKTRVLRELSLRFRGEEGRSLFQHSTPPPSLRLLRLRDLSICLQDHELEFDFVATFLRLWRPVTPRLSVIALDLYTRAVGSVETLREVLCDLYLARADCRVLLRGFPHVAIEDPWSQLTQL